MNVTRKVTLIIGCIVIVVCGSAFLYVQSHHHRAASAVTASAQKSNSNNPSPQAVCNGMAAETASHLGQLSSYDMDQKTYQCAGLSNGSPGPENRILYLFEGTNNPAQTRENLTAQIDTWLAAAGWEASSPLSRGGYSYTYTLSSDRKIHASVGISNPTAELVSVRVTADEGYTPQNIDNSEPADINPTNRVERLQP